jgi:hypothetical protein
MIHINGSYSMHRAKGYIKYGNTKKHNIIFDTKGMYNDMLNDNNTKYWCVRNKVKKTRVISYSGKAPCLCCGKPVIEKMFDSYNEEDVEYNERYDNVGSVVCDSCKQDFRCDLCGDIHLYGSMLYRIKKENGEELQICAACAKRELTKCPCCGKTFLFKKHEDYYAEDSRLPYYIYFEDYNEHELTRDLRDSYKYSLYINRESYEDSLNDFEKEGTAYRKLFRFGACSECLEKIDKYFDEKEVDIYNSFWGSNWINIKVLKKDCMDKFDPSYTYYRLNKPKIEDEMVISD